MKRSSGLIGLLCLLSLAGGTAAWAQAQPQGSVQPSATSPQKGEPLQPGSTQGGRTTSEFDAIPKFNMDYFVGEWKFEGDVADSPLGEGGRLTGTEIVRNVWDGRFWDITITGEGADGQPFTGKGIFLYADGFSGQTFVRYEFTRGAAMLKTGTLSCDNGGTCGLYYETPPFEYNKATLRLRGRFFLSGAFSYRLTTEISVDKGEFTNLGTVWYRRDQQAPRPTPIK